MKRATLSRRLLASAAGLTIGLGGALALAAPAQATNIEGPRAKVHQEFECDGLKLKLIPYAPKSGNSFRVLDANGDLIWPEGLDVSEYGPDNLSAGWVDHGSFQLLAFGPDTAFPLEVSYWSGSNPGGPNWRSAPFDGINWPLFFDWAPAPGLWPECGDSPKVEIVEDCDGNVTVTIHAGDTRRTWRVDGQDERFLDVDQSDTWDAASLDALVEWWHENSKQWKEADKEYVTRTPAEDCPTTPPDDDGEGGGELPKTGNQALLVAGGALVLLTLGGVMYLVARRRRISFTA